MQPETTRLRLAPFLIIFAVVLAYNNSFSGSFVFDDIDGIVRNPEIRNFPSAILGTSRPVVNLTFFLNYSADGLRIAGYHLFNIVVHVLASLTLFGIVKRTLGSEDLCVKYNRSAETLAFVTALLWGVHPLNTSSVTYIIQRGESLMGLFYLFTLYCVLVGIRSPNSHKWYTAAIVSCALGMAGKPVMVTAPLLVLMYDRFFISRSFTEAFRRRRRMYAGLAATLIIPAGLLSMPHESSSSVGLKAGLLSPIEYLLTQQGVIVHYLKLAFWPRSLCLDYAWRSANTIGQVLIPCIFVVSLLVLTVWASVRRRPIGFAGLWFFVILAPTSSIVPIADCAFEHRMYLPLAGVIIVTVIALYGVLGKHIRPRILFALACAVAVGLGFMTRLRNEDYRSEETMWRDVVEKRPYNLRARNDLAVALSEAGKVREAMAQYNHVLSLIPENIRSRLDSGSIKIDGILPADSYEYHYFRAHANMGLLIYQEEKNAKKAAEHYAAALRVVPFHDGVRKKLKRALRTNWIPEKDLAAEIENILRHGTVD